MAIITKKEILERVKKKELVFKPSLDEFQLHGHAVDLRLGFSFLIPRRWHITKNGREALAAMSVGKRNNDAFDLVELEQGQWFELLPDEYVLVSTLETLEVPTDLMAVMYPRSSTNRRGLSVDLTGIVDAGYHGQLMIPVRNNTHSQTVRLYPGERLCQVAFEQLSEPVKEVRKSKYHQRDIVEGVISDKDEELQLVTSGQIRELKEKHRVD